MVSDSCAFTKCKTIKLIIIVSWTAGFMNVNIVDKDNNVACTVNGIKSMNGQ